jgi:hypothetical protein
MVFTSADATGATGATERRLTIFGRWPAGTAAGTYFVVLNDTGTLKVIGKFIVPANAAGRFAISGSVPPGTYTPGALGTEPGTITVYNGKWSASDQPDGTWSPGSFDPVLTATLNYA